ncbi:MAG: oxidoreductase [Flavobacteriales bacterium]|nr:oxidoreductase [Flavobacteriales bacterium]
MKTSKEAMPKHPSKTGTHIKAMLIALPLLWASCGSTDWHQDRQGILHMSIPGSWRAIASTSPNEAWLAGSNGEWVHITHNEGAGTVRRMADQGVMVSDTMAPLHFRGIAVTSEAVIATAIASPAHIQWASIQADGTVKLPRQSVWINNDSAAFLDAIIALDDQTLIAMGDPLGTCLCVVRSEDGGQTWKKLPCADFIDLGVPQAMPGEAAFAASNGNLAAQGDTVWMLSGGRASRVYRSTDRGENWQVFPTPLQQGGAMTGGFSMDFADAQRGILWGGNWEAKDDRNGRAAITEDGGETWTVVAEDHGPGYGSSVRYQPGSGGRRVVVVGTPGGIDLSEDGGRNWRHFSDSAFYAARFSPDGSTLWLSGNGTVAKVSAGDLGW